MKHALSNKYSLIMTGDRHTDEGFPGVSLRSGHIPLRVTRAPRAIPETPGHPLGSFRGKVLACADHWFPDDPLQGV